jgi:hypothetical protein
MNLNKLTLDILYDIVKFANDFKLRLVSSQLKYIVDKSIMFPTRVVERKEDFIKALSISTYWNFKIVGKWISDISTDLLINKTIIKHEECHKWEQTMRNNWLTIKDVTSLKEGDTLEILVLDQDVYGIVSEYTGKDVIKHPVEFYKHNFATYTHKKNLLGDIVFHWSGEDFTIENYEFNIEYQKESWYPLINIRGILLPAVGRYYPQFMEEFPPTTCVGYKGPMIALDKLKDANYIYWNFDS